MEKRSCKYTNEAQQTAGSVGTAKPAISLQQPNTTRSAAVRPDK